ncbi:MAG: hypothetical protein ORN98_11250 [Alphaproteobacteria bacterium]|nr:hypothetical protein [Alphaproteobacteria bacterium]
MATLQDRMNNSALFDAFQGKGRFLRDWDVCAGEVNQLSTAYINLIMRFHKKEISDEELNKSQAQIAFDFQNRFYGLDNSVTYDQYWHRPEGLGKYIVDVCKGGGDEDDAIIRLAGQLYLNTSTAIFEFYSKDYLDRTEFQNAMKSAATKVCHALMGVPVTVINKDGSTSFKEPVFEKPLPLLNYD